MNTQSNPELDTIIELTDSIGPQSNSAPLSMNQYGIQGAHQNAMQDEAVFETLTAPKTSNGASFMPPYTDTPNVEQNPLFNDEIIELDSNTVVQPQYTVTTELLFDPLECGEKNKQAAKLDNIDSVHFDTVHADAMHVGEVHINTIHAAKLCESFTEQRDVQAKQGSVPEFVCESLHEAEKADAASSSPTQKSENSSKSLAKVKEYQEDIQNLATPELAQQILRDVSTLQTTVASMQLRLAAQDACIASLESRLMATEAKARELEAVQHKDEEITAQATAPQFDIAQVEKMTAATAARVVREEIQALLEFAERQQEK